MTEEQWLASDDPEQMLASLQGRASERKLRLFLVGCARRVLPASPDGDTVEALAVAERFADGAESRQRLAQARAALKVSRRSRVHPEAPLDTGHISSVPAWHAAREEVGPAAAREGASCCAWSTSLGPSYGGPLVGVTVPTHEFAAQAALLRDIFGNPYRPVRVPPAGQLPEVVALARAAYEQRGLPDGTLADRLLADVAQALVEAGCRDADVLNHFYRSAYHVRGCWLIDLLLGKE